MTTEHTSLDSIQSSSDTPLPIHVQTPIRNGTTRIETKPRVGIVCDGGTIAGYSMPLMFDAELSGLESEVSQLRRAQVCEDFRAVLAWIVGAKSPRAMGFRAMAVAWENDPALINHASLSDAARYYGVTRAALSKTHCLWCRHFLGIQKRGIENGNASRGTHGPNSQS